MAGCGNIGEITEKGTVSPPTRSVVSRKPTGVAAIVAPTNPFEASDLAAAAAPGREACDRNAAVVTPAIASLRPMIRGSGLEQRAPRAPTTPLRPGRAAAPPPIEDQAEDWCGSRARKRRACKDDCPQTTILATRGQGAVPGNWSSEMDEEADFGTLCWSQLLKSVVFSGTGKTRSTQT